MVLFRQYCELSGLRRRVTAETLSDARIGQREVALGRSPGGQAPGDVLDRRAGEVGAHRLERPPTLARRCEEHRCRSRPRARGGIRGVRFLRKQPPLRASVRSCRRRPRRLPTANVRVSRDTDPRPRRPGQETRDRSIAAVDIDEIADELKRVERIPRTTLWKPMPVRGSPAARPPPALRAYTIRRARDRRRSRTEARRPRMRRSSRKRH